MKKSDMKRKHRIQVNGETIEYHKVDSTINGCPRYVVHFLALGVKLADYGNIKGLERYRAKWFGGGYVFQSWSLEEDLKFYIKLVQDFYNKQAK